jgi:hypothetical protein
LQGLERRDYPLQAYTRQAFQPLPYRLGPGSEIFTGKRLLGCAQLVSKCRMGPSSELKPEEAEEDGIPLVAPETAGRHGPAPKLVKRPSLESEASFIVDWLKQRHEAGRPWNEMAVGRVAA